LRSVHPSVRETLAWQRAWAETVQELARVVCAGGASPAGLEPLLAQVDSLPDELRERTARLPACFQAFDLDVPDVVELTRRFVERERDRARPLLVVGVRTAGCYLAPLCAAVLESYGYTDVQVLSLRPQHRLLAAERALVRGIARREGLALVIDDPPESGRTVARAAEELTRLGFPPEAVVLLLPLFGDAASLAERLGSYPSVLLPGDEWSITDRLTAEAVGRALQRLLPPGTEAVEVRRLELPARAWTRSHARALFGVSLPERGAARSQLVLVEGVGIGYFGRQALAVAERLREHLPEVFGLDGGCLYRAWLPEEARICPPGSPPSDELVTAAARYVADRRLALPVAEDRSLSQRSAVPVWEVASRILSRTFGRGALAARLLLVDSLTKRLLPVARPSVVDGATSLSNWFFDSSRGTERLTKTEFAARSFWNLGLLSYDAVFDLAGAAVSAPDHALDRRLRSAYTARVREAIDDERWLIYGLAQLWGRWRTRPEDIAEVEREQARVLRNYLAHLYLDDLGPAREGPLCALDLDGVLETESLGFPATTSAGAKALRALICHGYRPVLVSGRSIGEVADRCRSYGLAGGAAEYGAAVYVAERDETAVLLTHAQRSTLDRAREVLAAHPGVRLDDAYTCSVRAFVVDSRGGRRGLGPADVRAVLDDINSSSKLEVVVGESQTDFTVRGVDKGTGVRALAERLEPTGELPLSLAVGDSTADLPILREADLRLAPAHAATALSREGVELLPAPYQAGLALAVGRLIGHDPGSCPACRAPLLGERAELLLELLSAGEAGRLELARRFARLLRRVRTLPSSLPPEQVQPWSSVR